MLYPDELRDRTRTFARFGLALKMAFVSTCAWAAHPCVGERVVDPGAVAVAASGIVWADGGRAPEIEGARVAVTMKKRDRYGRWQGFLLAPGASEPAQMDWLRAGLGYADPVGLKADCGAALLAAEAEARSARRGLWRRARVERAGDPTLPERTGRFALVEGRVVSVGDRERTVYLNFGTFWRQDFTVRVEKRDLKRHPELLARLVRAEGRTIRVRGTLELRDGPFMRVRDAGQIEFPALARPRSAAAGRSRPEGVARGR